MATGQTYKVTLDFSDGSQKNKSTGFYLRQDTVAGFDVGDVEGVVVDWWDTEVGGSGLTTGMKALYDPAYALEAVTLRKIDPVEATITTDSTGLPIAGTSAGDPLPMENATLVSLRTGNIGRSYRGRMYLPAVSDGQVDENYTLTVAGNIAEQTAGMFAQFNAGIGVANASKATPVVWSKVLSDSFEILTVKCDIYLRSQRRRNPRQAVYASQPV